MSTLADVSQVPSRKNPARTVGPRLTGVWQWVAVTAWLVILIISLVSAVLSIKTLYTWDRVPAAEAIRYFPNLDQQAIDFRQSFQDEILKLGFSLSSFTLLLTAFRVIGSAALFLLSVVLIRRYPQSLMGVIFAMVLAVMGASGIWQNTLLSWATVDAPWMEVPVQILNILLWFGLIFLYTFPDGRFTPRWTMGLVVLLVPMVIAMILDLQVFFNPATWPDPYPLLQNLVFIGVAFFSVLYRYRKADADLKMKLKGYVVSVSLLMVVYFIMFFMNDVYTALTGLSILNNNIRTIVTYVLINEPLWYVLEVIFVIGTARSLFRERLLEG